jgi:hypothetical protein
MTNIIEVIERAERNSGISDLQRSYIELKRQFDDNSRNLRMELQALTTVTKVNQVNQVL